MSEGAGSAPQDLLSGLVSSRHSRAGLALCARVEAGLGSITEPGQLIAGPFPQGEEVSAEGADGTPSWSPVGSCCPGQSRVSSCFSGSQEQ